MNTVMPDRLNKADTKSTLKIIDADTHLTESHDLWVRRAPAAWRDRVPQVKMHDGQMSWVIDGNKSIGTGAHPNSAILKDNKKVRELDEFLKLKFADVHPGSHTVKDRLAVMDEAGIYAQIVYPNILGFGGQAAAKVDMQLRQICVEIYNDAMAELQDESGDRLFPMAMLPWWDVDAAVKETERCAAMGLRGININSDPHEHKDAAGNFIPDLGSPHWDPYGRSASTRIFPSIFTLAPRKLQLIGWAIRDGHRYRGNCARASWVQCCFFNNGKVVSNLIFSGLLDRMPKLKFVSVESGIGWVPFLMEALDYQLVEIAANQEL
jgi:predicted TIM-barrel fold metal-dependent hydrolase